MTNEVSDPRSHDVSDSAVRGMVDALKPDWVVHEIERSPHGTDFVAKLTVQTPNGSRAVVLKATTADFVDPLIAKSEPRLLTLVGRETSIPVPTVFGYCDDHERFAVPFYLMEFIDGVNYEGADDDLPLRVRKTIIREAGENLAALHELGPLPASGKVGVQDKQLTVVDTDEHPRFDDFRDMILATGTDTLDSLASGGSFPELADDPTRFADLVPDLREYLHEVVPSLQAPDPPTYCHWDYRIGNLLVDPESGATQAVLDWANLSAAEPANNLAQTEFYLLNPEADGARQTARLRELFRESYSSARTAWEFDAATRERMAVYHLVCRLGAMACLPLWYQDESAATRDKRAREHRAFVEQYL